MGVGIVGARNDKGRWLIEEEYVLMVLQYQRDRGKFQRGSTTHERGREPGRKLYDVWTAGVGYPVGMKTHQHRNGRSRAK